MQDTSNNSKCKNTKSVLSKYSNKKHKENDNTNNANNSNSEDEALDKFSYKYYTQDRPNQEESYNSNLESGKIKKHPYEIQTKLTYIKETLSSNDSVPITNCVGNKKLNLTSQIKNEMISDVSNKGHPNNSNKNHIISPSSITTVTAISNNMGSETSSNQLLTFNSNKTKHDIHTNNSNSKLLKINNNAKDGNHPIFKNSNKNISESKFASKRNSNDLDSHSNHNDRKDEEISFKHDNFKGVHFVTNYNNIGSSQKLNLFAKNFEADNEDHANLFLEDLRIDKETIMKYPCLRIQSKELNEEQGLLTLNLENEESKEFKDRSQKHSNATDTNNYNNLNKNINYNSSFNNGIDNILFNNQEIIINVAGLSNKDLNKLSDFGDSSSLKDNITYFGKTSKQTINNSNSQNILNLVNKNVSSSMNQSKSHSTQLKQVPDIALNLNTKYDKALIESSNNNIFSVYFCHINKKYYFKFLNDPSIDKTLFYLKLKHKKEFILEKTLIVQLGNCLLKLIPGKVGRSNKSELDNNDSVNDNFVKLGLESKQLMSSFSSSNNNFDLNSSKKVVPEFNRKKTKCLSIDIQNNNNNLFQEDSKLVNYEISIVKYDKDPSNNKLFKFNSNTKTSITIGRSSDCDIQLKNSFISKVHLRIEFNNIANKWSLLDGSLRKPSSQGSWVILNSKVVIEENSEIKFNNHSMMFNFFKNK